MNWQLRVKERGTRTIQYPTIEPEEMSGICIHLYLFQKPCSNAAPEFDGTSATGYYSAISISHQCTEFYTNCCSVSVACRLSRFGGLNTTAFKFRRA